MYMYVWWEKHKLTPTLYTHESRFVPMIITAIGAFCVCTCGKEDIKERTGEREREVGDVRKKENR